MTIDAGLGHDLADVVDFLVHIVEAAGAVIIFAGAVSAFARFVRVAFRREGMAPFAPVRLGLGRVLWLRLAFLLDFCTAARLLRLVGPLTWPVLGTAALTIVIRQLASRGLVAAEGSDHLSWQRGRR